MSLVADTGAIYALYDADDAFHASVHEAVADTPGSIIVPSVILAELDYLLLEFLGVEAELDFLQGVSEGAYTLEDFTAADLKRCSELIRKYRDLKIGLADAAVVATAERLEIPDILTTDQRHFRVLAAASSRSFRLLPFDNM